MKGFGVWRKGGLSMGDLLFFMPEKHFPSLDAARGAASKLLGNMEPFEVYETVIGFNIVRTIGPGLEIFFSSPIGV